MAIIFVCDMWKSEKNLYMSEHHNEGSEHIRWDAGEG